MRFILIGIQLVQWHGASLIKLTQYYYILFLFFWKKMTIKGHRSIESICRELLGEIPRFVQKTKVDGVYFKDLQVENLQLLKNALHLL